MSAANLKRPRTATAHLTAHQNIIHAHIIAHTYFPWLCTCGELTGNTRGGWAVGYDKRAVQARAGHLERVVGARYTDNTRARQSDATQATFPVRFGDIVSRYRNASSGNWSRVHALRDEERALLFDQVQIGEAIRPNVRR